MRPPRQEAQDRTATGGGSVIDFRRRLGRRPFFLLQLTVALAMYCVCRILRLSVELKCILSVYELF